MHVCPQRLSTLVAAWLIALAISPVTAPFRTVDVSSPVGEIPVCEWSVGQKAAEDVADVVVLTDLVAESLITFISIADHSLVSDHPQVPPAVLRL